MHDGHDHGPITPTTPVIGEYLVDGPNKIYNYAYNPTTVSVKDGNWFDPEVWSNGVPNDTSRVQIDHVISISPITINGDLNGDGKVDELDWLAWDRKSLADVIRFGDVYFGVAVPYPGEAEAYSCLVTSKGTLNILNATTFTVCTLTNQGNFNLIGGDLIFCDCLWDYVKDAMQWGHGFLGLSGSKTVTRNSAVYSQASTNIPGRGHFAVLHSGSLDSESTDYNRLGRTQIGTLNNTQLEADGITAKHVGTNQMARYGGPHLHHCYGNVRIVDCDITNGSKWGITIHQSHFGLYENNRIKNCGGAGIAFEDGNEFANVVRKNIIKGTFGDGKGVQGHNGGANIQDVGNGTPENPYRTLGSHGNEGSGIWGRCVCNDIEDNEIENCPTGFIFWSRFQPNGTVLIPAAKNERPSVKVPAGDQLERSFKGNTVSNCIVGMNTQGIVGVFEAIDLTINKARTALDTSYNATLRFTRLHLADCFSCYKNGFTGKLELFDARVERCTGGFDLPNGIYVEGGVFETSKTTFGIQYKNVTGGQSSITLRGPRFTGTGQHLVYVLGDLNKNRGYHAPRDLFCYDWNGVEGDNFQVLLPQQAADYVPRNSIAPHFVRITPEPGITNEAMLDKYLLCLNGRVAPANAVVRPKITGLIIPILPDLEPPEIINLTQTVNATGIVVKFETTKPSRFRVEWNTGDIRWGIYSNLVLPIGKEFKTQHEFSINGLVTGKKHNYIVQVVDEHSNLGGDTRVASMNYIPRFFTPK